MEILQEEDDYLSEEVSIDLNEYLANKPMQIQQVLQLFRNQESARTGSKTERNRPKTYRKFTTPKLDMEKKFSKIRFTPIVKDEELNTKYHERFKKENFIKYT